RRTQCSTLFPYTTLFRSGFIEDVRLGIDLQARIRQAQTRRDFADTDNGYTCVFNCPEWLFSELASERNSILVKDVAQSLRYTKGDRKSTRLNSSHQIISY